MTGPPVKILRQHQISSLRQYVDKDYGARVEAIIQKPPKKPSEPQSNTKSMKIDQTPLKGTQKDAPTTGDASSASSDKNEFSATFDFVIGAEGDYSRVRDLLWAPDEIAQKVHP